MRSLRPLLPALALLAVACNPDAPKQYLIPGLRILAINDHVDGTSTADADLTETIALEALLSNPDALSPVTVDWYACAPVLTSELPPCVDPAWLQRPDDLPSAPGVFSLGSGAAVTTALPSALQAVLQAAVDTLLPAALLDPTSQCRLYLEVPIVAIARAGGSTEVAIKRVRVTPTAEIAASFPSLSGAYVVNLNPAIGAIQLDPADADACTGGTSLFAPCVAPADCGGGACGADGYCEVTLGSGKHKLCASGATGWLQTYNQCQPDGTRIPIIEVLEWQWYVSGGTFTASDFAGNATDNPIEFEPPSGPFTLWVIVRDGRGGTAWVVRTLSGP